MYKAVVEESRRFVWKRKMPRKYIYYFLTALLAVINLGGILNAQFVIVMKGQPWSSAFGWELILAGFGALIYAAGSLFIAPLSDKFGRIPCIAASCFIICLMQAMMGFYVLGAYQLWHFFFYWGTVCLAISLFFTSVEGLLSDYQDRKKPLERRLGLYCLSWAAGDMVGVYMTGYIKEAFGAAAMFRIFGGISLTAFVIAVVDWLRHGDKKMGDAEIAEADIHPKASFHASLGRFGIFWSCVAFSAILAAFPRFGRDYHKLSEGVIGGILSLNLFICAVTFIVFPLWKKWQYNLRWQIGLQGLMAAGLALFLAAPSGSVSMLRLGLIFFGFGWSVAYFFSIFYSLTVPADHAKSGGMHEAVLGLGNLIGPIASVGAMALAERAGGVSSERIGFMAFYIALAAVLLSFGIQFFKSLRRNEKRL